MKKIAVLFPGIGYTCAKPLLYYSAKLAQTEGYEIKRVEYGGFPSGVKGNKEKMKDSFDLALARSREILSDIAWETYDEILFVSKSIGTAVACAYAGQQGLKVRSILYTPLAETYSFLQTDAGASARPGSKISAQPQTIAFHGTADPWAATEEIIRLSKEHKIPLYLTENANHSLETGEVMGDIKELKKVMKISREFIRG